MKKHSKWFVVLMVVAMVLALFAVPVIAQTPADANSNSISIAIISSPAGPFHEGDTIDYRVRVSVDAPDPEDDFYPAQQTDIEVYLKLPGETDYSMIHTIPELDPGENSTSAIQPYVVDLDHVEEGTAGQDIVKASAKCDGTAQLEDPVPSEASVSITRSVVYEELEVEKTVETSYNREHFWEIEKEVTTDNGYFLGEIPKIWLVPDESGDEDAEWTVDVTYEGYDDSGFNVSGEITVTNTGTAPAVIVDVEDVIDGVNYDVDWPADFAAGDTLAVGDSITLTYSADVPSKVVGENEAMVITERDDYFAYADIVWGEPDEETNATVNIDDVSDLFGDVYLGSVTAPDDGQFTYGEYFAWVDYDAPGPYTYENTATIRETGQYDDAVLKINWQDEELTVSKTVETYFEREHEWDITKEVTTEKGDTIGAENTPKIWLLNEGDEEWAEWEVCVTYEGYEDFAHEVWGEITIYNSGELTAVIESISDVLGGTSIDIDWNGGLTFPYYLDPGESLVGTYSEEGNFEGDNVVTVTTNVRDYGTSEPIVWGEPDVEYLDVVDIVDVSDLFGAADLGTLTAPNGDCFTYTNTFEWADYSDPGPHIYENTATIVQTGQSAEAILKINWDEPGECYGDETAWAFGNIENNSLDGTGNAWGWTDGPLEDGTYTRTLWAGAGQNDTSKGDDVGTVTIAVYDDCVEVTYQITEPGVYLGEVHLWVGDTPLPPTRRGFTAAPGQFPYGEYIGFEAGETMETTWTWSDCGFEGDIYVAAHAVVWMEVECEEYNNDYEI